MKAILKRIIIFNPRHPWAAKLHMRAALPSAADEKENTILKLSCCLYTIVFDLKGKLQDGEKNTFI